MGLDNWSEKTWIQPGWLVEDGHRELIHVAFMAAPAIATLSKVLGCDAIVDTLSYAFILWEESLAFIGSVEDQREMAPKGALVHHPKDSLPPWCDSADLF